MGLKAQPLEKGDFQRWEAFLEGNSSVTIFHTLEWKRVLEETFGYEPDYLVVKDQGGEVVGISPAFLVKTLWGKALVSQPLFEYGGPCVAPGFEEAYREMLRLYRERVDTRKAKYVEIRPLPGGEEAPFREAGFVKQFKAYDFHLETKGKDFEKDIWLGLYTKKSRIRNSVKKATASGVRAVETEDLATFYALYLKTMSRLGSPPFPRALFENIKRGVRSPRFTLALLEGRAISGLMSLSFNGRHLLVTLASDERYQEFRANDLLYNEEIRYAVEKGFDLVDLGRTRPNSTYERYKSKWNATRTDLYSWVYPQSARGRVEPYKPYLLLSHLTRRIPWVFTRTALGPYLAKRFP